ncbi:hypothetical protein OENI_450012 [Oenococcus oeni]|nr:hypothetical protein OENI_450012 [Oenococcus oeni]
MLASIDELCLDLKLFILLKTFPKVLLSFESLNFPNKFLNIVRHYTIC